MNKTTKILLIGTGIFLIYLLMKGKKPQEDMGLDTQINPIDDGNRTGITEGQPVPSPKGLIPCKSANMIFQEMYQSEVNFAKSLGVEKKGDVSKVSEIDKDKLMKKAVMLHKACKENQARLMADFKNSGVTPPSTADQFIKRNA